MVSVDIVKGGEDYETETNGLNDGWYFGNLNSNAGLCL